MTNRLLDKVAVVTGVGSDIGREIALMVANEGAFVVVNDFQHDQVDLNSCILVDRVVEEIRSAGGIATPSYTDPVVMEREAGWRQRHDICYEPTRIYKPKIPKYCWQVPCSTVFPCHRFHDPSAKALGQEYHCVPISR